MGVKTYMEIGGNTLNLQNCYDDYYRQWFDPVFISTYIDLPSLQKDKYFQAFAVLKVLVAKKVVHLKTPEDFITLIDEIAKVI